MRRKRFPIRNSGFLKKIAAASHLLYLFVSHIIFNNYSTIPPTIPHISKNPKYISLQLVDFTQKNYIFISTESRTGQISTL
ncbi:hypothetical protein PSAC2689_110263 [Paraburkholderia sacchari]